MFFGIIQLAVMLFVGQALGQRDQNTAERKALMQQVMAERKAILNQIENIESAKTYASTKNPRNPYKESKGIEHDQSDYEDMLDRDIETAKDNYKNIDKPTSQKKASNNPRSTNYTNARASKSSTSTKYKGTQVSNRG